jgi:demethylmenaquinone methyltransferase / 2-methoxy-6-polyprenyl-1,4-benzoquinol methylase
MTCDANNPAAIAEMFSRISPRYDLVNRLASAGFDGYWRRRVVAAARPRPTDHLLDICCGTGDIGLSFAAGVAVPCRIVGIDLSPAMLDRARAKQERFIASRAAAKTSFEWLCGDCTKLDFADSVFDVLTCAFGLRNIPDFTAALKESYRVLRPSGRLCILEFSLPKRALIRTIYLFYFQIIMPWIAGLISGQPQAYRYLARSVCRWSSGVDMPGALMAAGFRDIRTVSLTLGVAQLYVAEK